jgi:hypothetical protein
MRPRRSLRASCAACAASSRCCCSKPKTTLRAAALPESQALGFLAQHSQAPVGGGKIQHDHRLGLRTQLQPVPEPGRHGGEAETGERHFGVLK